MLTVSGGPPDWWACHCASWAHAVSSTHAPIGTMKPVSSARPMNSSGPMQTPNRVTPPHERLEAGELPGLELEHRLVLQLELAPLQRPVQGVAGLEVLEGADPGPLVEELGPAPTPVLRPVHRGVGVPDQGLGRVASPFRAGDPDAGGHEDLPGREHHRPFDLGQDPLGEGHDRIGVVHVGAQDRELVAAEAGHRVGRAQDAAEPVPDGHQQLVARIVAEAVVDHLEVVEVEEQHPDPVAAAAGTGPWSPGGGPRTGSGSAARSGGRGSPGG